MSLFTKLFSKKTNQEALLHRQSTLINQFDFLLDTLENNKFDILYMENLKNPLTTDEKLYFTQQIGRIESAIKVTSWMKNNVIHNGSFWRRLLKW